MFWDHLVLNSLYRKYSLGPFSFKFSMQGNMFWDHLVLNFKMLIQCKQHLRENKNQMRFGDHWLI